MDHLIGLLVEVEMMMILECKKVVHLVHFHQQEWFEEVE